MCDHCAEVLQLIESYEERCLVGGFHMNKREILSFVSYANTWPQRQCMCCFKNLKNFEKLNNMVQVICSVAIRVIQTMPEDFNKEQQKELDINNKDKKRESIRG